MNTDTHESLAAEIEEEANHLVTIGRDMDLEQQEERLRAWATRLRALGVGGERLDVDARTAALEKFWKLQRAQSDDREGVQDDAVEAGLMVAAPYDPAVHGSWPADEYGVEPGDPIYVDAKEFAAALPAPELPSSAEGDSEMRAKAAAMDKADAFIDAGGRIEVWRSNVGARYVRWDHDDGTHDGITSGLTLAAAIAAAAEGP